MVVPPAASATVRPVAAPGPWPNIIAAIIIWGVIVLVWVRRWLLHSYDGWLLPAVSPDEQHYCHRCEPH